MSAQKWLNCRLCDIRQTLDHQGHRVSKPVISRILRAHGYSLRANVKQHAGKQHPERDQQFAYIQAQRVVHEQDGNPAISVDTKKKELVGNFKNAGRIWCQNAEAVDAHDFPQDAVGRAVPYGIYDQRANRGTVYIGCSADTPTFKVDPMSSTTFEPVFSVGAPVTRLKRLTRGLRARAGHSGPAGPLCPALAEKIGRCPSSPLSVIQIGRTTIVERLMRSLGVVER